MSLILILISLFELLVAKRGGRFFLFFVTGIILYIKSVVQVEHAYWDLIILLLVTGFVLSRLKINHKGS